MDAGEERRRENAREARGIMGRPGSGNRDAENILCPLFIEINEKEIRCAPHVPEARATIIWYRSPEACRKQRATFCEGCWERCEHYLSWKHFVWDEDEDIPRRTRRNNHKDGGNGKCQGR